MTEDSWWDHLLERPHTPIGDLVAGFADISALQIPYARLPARARTNYAPAFARWSDLADETLTSLIKRPKGGRATVRTIIGAARATIATVQSPKARDDRDVAAAVSELLAYLPERDRIVLAGRVWAREPLAQKDVAAQLGTNDTWIYRRQPRAQARFAELCADPEHHLVVDQAEKLRRQLGPVTNRHHIGSALNALGIDATSDDGAMLVHLAGPYSDHGPWAVHQPGDGLATAVAAIERTFDRQPAPSITDFRQVLGAIGVPADIADQLVAAQPGLRRFGDQWVRWGTSKADKAEAVLHLSVNRTPATLEMIAAAVGEDYSVQALRQALYEDPRFARASQYTWALHSWGLREYCGIFSEIATRVDAAGGAIRTADLLNDIATQFPDVAESSITTYMNSLAFKIERGVVRRRTASDPWPTIPPLNRARGTFRNGQNQIRLAIPVGVELLRGSGQPLPRPVAQALSVGPGHERLFTGPIDAIVRWRVSSARGPTMTALRQLADAIDAGSGDTIVLAFNLKDSTLQAARLRAGETLHRQLVTLLGRPAPDPISTLARSLDCTPSEVIDVLRHRGDDTLADLLDEAAVPHRPPPRAVDSAESPR
jgi:hypothetical protein